MFGFPAGDVIDGLFAFDIGELEEIDATLQSGDERHAERTILGLQGTDRSRCPGGRAPFRVRRIAKVCSARQCGRLFCRLAKNWDRGCVGSGLIGHSWSSQPGEILWSNAPYALGLVAALAHRPIASAMLNEVLPLHWRDPRQAAHLIIWYKFDPIPGMPSLQRFRAHALTRVDEDDLAILFRQAGVQATAHPPQRIVPWWVAAGLLGLLLGGVVWDSARHH